MFVHRQFVEEKNVCEWLSDRKIFSNESENDELIMTWKTFTIEDFYNQKDTDNVVKNFYSWKQENNVKNVKQIKNYKWRKWQWEKWKQKNRWNNWFSLERIKKTRVSKNARIRKTREFERYWWRKKLSSLQQLNKRKLSDQLKSVK